MSDPSARRIYKNPPIEEALVEFRFVPTEEWDLTLLGKLHERVKDAYPGKPRQQHVLRATVQSAQGQAPGLTVQEGIGRVHLLDSTGLKLLSLGPDVLSVNVLRPYDGWRNFHQRIEEAMNAYAAVSGAKQVSRIGVRYINRIVISSAEVNRSEYFLCGPVVLDGLPKKLSGFHYQTEHVFDDGIKLILIFASIEDSANGPAFLIDLDVAWEGNSPLDINDALQMVDALHEREGYVFEAVITAKLRDLFDAD